MSIYRKAAKRDANEPEIVDALRSVGAKVWRMSGRGLPDVLVMFRGKLYAAEIKTAKGKLTKHQGEFPVWRSPAEALKAIGAIAA